MSSNKWILVAGGFVAGLIVGVLIMMVAGPSGGGSASSSAPAPILPGQEQQQGPDKLKLAREAEQLESIVKGDPKNYQALASLGNTYFDLGEAQKSVDAYRRALAIKDDDPNVWTDMGVMYRQLKNFDEAVKAFRKAASLSPTHPQSRMNLGVVFMHDLNDSKAAIEAWEDYLRVAPSAPNAAQIRQSIEELRRRAGGQSELDQAAQELGKQLNKPPAK